MVETAQGVSVSSSETQSSVEISETSPADGGSYTIIVRNKEGSANHTVSLIVIGGTMIALMSANGALSPSCLSCVNTIWIVCRPT